MPILQVRDLPENLYQKLAQQARKEHRSLSQQAIVELKKSLDLPSSGKERRIRLLEQMHEWHSTIPSETLPDPATLIREDRDR